MAKPRRILRLQALILRTVATHVHRELGDPRIGLVSITRVKLSPDLTQAQVFWSSLGDEGQQRTIQRGLDDALASIQRAVAKAMQTRVTPRLTLRRDETLAKSQHMEDLFEQIRRERGDEPAPPVDPEDSDEPEVPDEAVVPDEPAAG